MSYKNDLLAAAMAKDLRKLAEEYPQAIYRFSEWADFVEQQQQIRDLAVKEAGSDKAWRKVGIIKGFLHEALEKHPDMTDTIQECAQFVDDQQRLIDRYDAALENAAKQFHKELVKLTPDDVEVILPDELIAEWKSEAGIPAEDGNC